MVPVLTLVAALTLLQADGGEPQVVFPTAKCPGNPEYPASEKGTGVQGQVVLRVTLDVKGALTAVEAFKPLGPAFDAAAIEGAKACTYTPAFINGAPSPAIIELTVDFVPPVEPWVLEGEVVGELGEALANADVSYGGQSTRTDDKGRFSMSFPALPPGDAWVQVHKDGFNDKGFPEVFKQGKTTRVRYPLSKEKVLETRVEGSRLLPAVPDADKTPQVSRFTLTKADIDRTPGALEDISRVAQAAPGVAADPDLLATFFVRGGGPDEVVYYLDGVPLTNPYHLGGFASIFNPMMIDQAEFFTGGVPARYEPALSGAFEVRYANPDAKRVSFQADVSMLSAKMRMDAPLGPEGLTASVSFRRSYFELYFAGLSALGIVGSGVVAPDITEFLTRVNYRRGNHQTSLSLIHASDGLDFFAKPGEQVLVNFAGGLKVSNTSQLVIANHKIDLAGDSELSFTGAYTRDENRVAVEGVRSFGNDAFRNDVLARADLKWAHSDRLRSSFGLSYAYRTVDVLGKVTDSRATAPWSNDVFVQTYQPYLQVRPSLKRNLLALYGEHLWRPLDWYSVEAGGRGEYDTASNKWTGSARVAMAFVAPTATVVKLSGGFAAQQPLRALQLDPTFGNPSLGAERSYTGVVGIEQPLPIEALVRLEGWVKALDNLVVNPDSEAVLQQMAAEGVSPYRNRGTGFAKGLDFMMLGRTRFLSYGVTMGLLQSERTNPLAARPTYAAPWDQRFTLGLSLSWSPTSKWIVTGRFNYRTGRPYTPIASFNQQSVFDDLSQSQVQRYVPTFGDTNSARFPNFYELSLRGEHRFRFGPLDMAVYAEVLNVTNTQNVFTYVYDTGDVAAGTEPQATAFNHLPIRPFLGLRAEY